MHPVLVKIGTFTVYSYGVLVAIGFLAGLWIAATEAGRAGLDREAFYDLGIWAVIAGVAGARLFHVLVYWRDYQAAPLEILKLWNGGLVFYGGFIAAVPACLIVLRRRKIPFLPAADAAALGIPLGLSFGRLGCTAAGCCYGKFTAVPWAIIFTDPGTAAPRGIPLHPTQLYESLGALVIFALLYAAKDRPAAPGTRFCALLLMYGILRFLLEFLRDDPRGVVGPFSESQVVSALLAAAGAFFLVRARLLADR